MGIIRGALVTLVTILLFVSLFFTGVCLTVSFSLDYNVLKPEIKNIVYDVVLSETNFSKILEIDSNIMTLACQNKTLLNKTMGDYSFEIPCDLVNNGSEAVFDYALEKVIEENYYKEYDCSFLECFSDGNLPFFVFSKHSQNFWNSLFSYGLLISIILCAILFLFMQTRTSYPILLGILFSVLSFLFLWTGKLVSMIINWQYAHVLGVFFTQSYLVFLIYIILGVLLIALGLVLKFLSFGRFIAGLFGGSKTVSKEDIKKEVKEVIEEEKKPKKKSKK